MRNPIQHPVRGDVLADHMHRFRVVKTRVNTAGYPLIVLVQNIGGELHGCCWWMDIIDFRAGFRECRVSRRGLDLSKAAA